MISHFHDDQGKKCFKRLPPLSPLFPRSASLTSFLQLICIWDLIPGITLALESSTNRSNTQTTFKYLRLPLYRCFKTFVTLGLIIYMASVFFKLNELLWKVVLGQQMIMSHLRCKSYVKCNGSVHKVSADIGGGLNYCQCRERK